SADVVKTLGRSARALAFPALLKLANDADEESATAGLIALVELGPLTETEIGVLTEALEDVKRRVWVRRFAAFRLGEQGEKSAKAVPALSKVLETEKDFKLLSYSITALRRIGDKRKEALDALVSLIVSHPEEKIRLQALEAVETLDLSGFPTTRMLDCLASDKSKDMRLAIAKRLDARLNRLKPEQMTDLVPFLRHKDEKMIRIGLGIVQTRKSEAAAVSVELAALTKHSDATLGRLAFKALQAVGPAAKDAVPLLLESLKEAPPAQRHELAVTIGTIEPNDPKVLEVVLPQLLESLHPRAIEMRGPTLTQINKVLVSIGQPAVEEIFKQFATRVARGKDALNHRKHLYLALASLGPKCRSKENYDRLKGFRGKENQAHSDVLEAAGKALKAMDPD